MTPGVRQAALAALALAALTFVAGGIGDPAETEPPLTSTPDPAPSTPVVASTLAFTDAAPATSVAGAETSLPSSSSTASTPPRRTLEIRVAPEEAEATISAVVDGTEVAAGPAPLETTVSGVVEVAVTADGYRPETFTVAPDRRGLVEVWLDPPDQLVDRTTVVDTGAAPKQVAFTPDGSELWVTLLGGVGVQVFDPATGSMETEIDLPEAGAVEVVFDGTGERAFVSQMETASVYEIDTDSYEVIRRLDTGGSWTKVMTLSPDGSTLWASNWVSDDVTEFDLASGEAVRRIPTVATPRGLAVDSDTTTLYVAGFEDGVIQAIDLATGEGSIVHRTGGAMRHLVADHDGDVVYASDMATDQIFAVDTGTGTVTEVAGSDRLPNTIDVSPDGRFLAVSNRGRNNPESYYLPGPEWGTILLIDTRSGRLLDAVVGGNQPTGLDISPDGRRLAYSDFLDDRVTVLRLPPTDELMAGDGGRADTYEAEIPK